MERGFFMVKSGMVFRQDGRLFRTYRPEFFVCGVEAQERPLPNAVDVE